MYINQEKTYSGLENQQRYWGEAVNGGAVLVGDDCIKYYLVLILIFSVNYGLLEI